MIDRYAPMGMDTYPSLCHIPDDPIINDLILMSSAENYHNWIFSQFKEHLGQRVVELGGGIGTYTELLLDREFVVVVDNYWPCVEYLRERFCRHESVLPKYMDIESHHMKLLRNYKPDSIICINVLEHVKEDFIALLYMSHILQDGGKLVLLVPAYQFLYGTIDRIVGHHRRYSKNDLKKKIFRAGLKIEDMFYMNSFAAPCWFINNRILRKKEESANQISLYDRFFVPILQKLEGIRRPPFGLSLVVIASK